MSASYVGIQLIIITNSVESTVDCYLINEENGA